MTNYDVIRVERKTAEYTVISSPVEKRAQNREKNTSGDYFLTATIVRNILLQEKWKSVIVRNELLRRTTDGQ